MTMKSGKHKSGGQLVRLSQDKHRFEVVAKQGAVLKYRNGTIAFNDVLMIDQIFTNSARGNIANVADLNDVFGTDDIRKCCEEIVQKGEIQYTAQERRKFVEEKTNEIIYYIHKNYINPKSKLPHSHDRIANAIKECHIRVDVKGDTRRQSEHAVKKMRGKLMFAKAVTLGAKLTIKASHFGQCRNLIHKITNVLHEEWIATGCVFTLPLSKADIDQLQTALMKPTNGDYKMTFLDETNKWLFIDPNHTIGVSSKWRYSSTGKKGKYKKKKQKNKSGYLY